MYFIGLWMMDSWDNKKQNKEQNSFDLTRFDFAQFGYQVNYSRFGIVMLLRHQQHDIQYNEVSCCCWWWSCTFFYYN